MKAVITFSAKVLTAFAVFNFFIFSLYGQLNGNYTINPNVSASSTNYQNWASAIGDMLSGTRTDGGTAQGSGLSGAVVFSVYEMVYSNTQLTITPVTGASATNTITFRSAGGDSSRCVLQFPSGTSATDDYVIMLNGAQHIRFIQIGFERTGTNSHYTVIQLLNNANHNSFTRCWMKTRRVPSNTTTGWTTGVGAHFFFSGNADTTTISQNYMLYGYNGIYGTTPCSGNIISKNVFDTTGCVSVYLTNQTAMVITQNTFNLGDFGTGQGHYISYALRIETSPAIVVTKNKIYMTAINAQVVRAIVFVNISGTSTARTLVNNNWIVNTAGTSSSSGISIYGINYLDIYYNNFLTTNSLAAGSVIHHHVSYPNTYVNIVNNNLINKGGGMIYDFPGTNGGLDTVINNNCYVIGSTFGRMNSIGYNSLSAWTSATGKDANSLNVDPGYVSNTDLHVSNIAIDRKAIPYFRVLDDIDGDTRDVVYPDIGADEFFPIANDAGISSLDSPFVFCAGWHNVRVLFQNYGYDTLRNLDIHWKVNNVTQSVFNWSGNVAPGNASASINLGSYNFASNTPYNIVVWTEKPNNTTDGNTLNDTLKTTIYAGMTGVYTIGDVSGTDFKSFNNAITALTTRGICGTITFNVYDGTYREQLTIAQLPGMGISNPVLFQSISGDSSKIIIELPSSTATGNNNAVLQLNGADYVAFKGITFMRTGTHSISQVVHILNAANNNSFENCQMINIMVTSNNANGNNIWSDQGEDNSNVFRNNFVKFGTHAMLFLGEATAHETGNVIEGNIFDSAYSNLVQIGYNDGVLIKGNTFGNSISTVSGNFDLQLLACDSNIRVEANRFYNLSTNTAIHLTGCNASVLNPGIVANNFIAKPSLTGILLDAVNNQNIVFNSLNFTGTGTSNAGIMTTNNSSSNIVLKNNIVVMNGGYVFNVSNGSHISASNRNNLLSNSSQFIYWAGTNYSTLSAFTTAISKDVNSMSVDPQFVLATDLHIRNQALKSNAEPIAGVTTDIDNELRDPFTPDIGADELAPPPNDAGILALISPNEIVCIGSHQIKVVLKNFGRDTLKNVTIAWMIDNNIQTPYNWTGQLSKYQVDTVLLGNYLFSNSGLPKIKIYSSMPNGVTDQDNNNDTFNNYILVRNLPVVNLGADLDLCSGDSVLTGPSAVTGFTYLWTALAGTTVGSSAQLYLKPLADETYVLFVNDTIGKCSNSDTISVFVKALPSAAFTVNDTSQCLRGNTYSFNNSSSGANSYLWDFGNGDTSTTASPQYSYLNVGNYVVKLHAITQFACSSLYSKNVYVRAQPITDFSVNMYDQCFSINEYIFTNTGSGHTGSFWDFGDTSFSTDISPPAKIYLYHGAKNVKLRTTTDFGCSDSITKLLNIFPEPKAAFSINDPEQCLNQNNFVFTNNSAGASAYSWSFGDGNGSSYFSPSNVYSSEGSYNVKLICENTHGCKDSIIKQVDVRAVPVSSFTVNDSNHCLKANNVVFTNSSTGANSYQWDFGDYDTSTLQSPSHIYKYAGTFRVYLTSMNDYGCYNITDRQIHIHPSPTASFSINKNNQCLNDNFFQFTNNSTISGGSFDNFWYFGDGNSDNGLNASYSYSDVGSYSVRLWLVSDHNCQDSIIRNIEVKPHPFVFLGEDDTIYGANQKIIDAGAGFDAYLWSTTETSQVIIVDSIRFGTGVKSFWVKVTKDECDGFDTVVISIMQQLSVKNLHLSSEISIYPNPAKDVIFINLPRSDKKISLILTDIGGKELQTLIIEPHSNPLSYKLDISTLSKGLYLLKVYDDKLINWSKIIKH